MRLDIVEEFEEKKEIKSEQIDKEMKDYNEKFKAWKLQKKRKVFLSKS